MLCDMVVHKQFQDHFLITSSFATVAQLLILLLFSYYSHYICLALAATPPHYLILPISLNSLDLAGFGIAESQWLTDTTKTVEGADDTSVGDATEFKWELDEDLVRCVVLFLLISSGAQLGRSGIQHLGLSYFHLDLTVVGLCVDFG